MEEAEANGNIGMEGVNMKQFIVLCSTIILGITIFNMIMGEGSDSVINTVSQVWLQGIQTRTNIP